MRAKISLTFLLFFFLINFNSIMLGQNRTNKVRIEKVKALLIQLEKSIKPSGLSDDWKLDKKIWHGKIKKIVLIESLRKLVYELELNLRYKSQSGYWRNFLRSDWLIKIKKTESLKELVKLIVLFESSIFWGSQVKSWKKYRKKWITSANKITGESLIIKKIQDQDETLISSIRKLAILIQELEKKIKYQAQKKSWQNYRKKWIEKLKSANSIELLTNELIKLHNNIKLKYFADKWNKSLKYKWLKNIKTSDFKKFAKSLIELERGLKWLAHYKTWWTKREKWIRQANNISGSKVLTIKLDTTRPDIKNAILRISGFLVALEGSILEKNFKPEWKKKRTKWIFSLFKSKSINEISHLARILKFSLKKNIYSGKWKSVKTWGKKLFKVKYTGKLVKYIFELETAIKWKSHKTFWKNNRNFWYQNISTLSGVNKKIPSKLDDRIAYNLNRIRKAKIINRSNRIIKTIASLMIEFENYIYYRVKSKYWRILWIKRVVNAKTFKRLGYLFYRLETKIPYRAQINTWRRKRQQWKFYIQRTGNVKNFVSLILECEKSLKWFAHTTQWKSVRNFWVDKIKKIINSDNSEVKYVDAKKIPLYSENTIYKHIENLISMQNGIKHSSFKIQNSKKNEKWIWGVLKSKDFSSLSKSLGELEKMIKYSSTNSIWKHIRVKWLKQIENLNDSNKFTKALIYLEKNIKWRAHTNLWKTERALWYKRLLSSRLIPDKKAVSRKTAKSIQKLSMLVFKLERNLKRSSFITAWNELRKIWLINLFNSKSLIFLSNRIKEMIKSIKFKCFHNWKYARNKLMKRVKLSHNIKNLKQTLIILEKSVKNIYKNSIWSLYKREWLKKILAIN